MGEPVQQPQAASRRDRLVFLLTLAAVVVAAALVGYLLGQYAFSRWVFVPPAPPAAPRLAELGEPAQVGPGAGVPAQPSAAPREALEPPPAARPERPTLGQAENRQPAEKPARAVQEGPGRPEGYFVQVGAFSQSRLAEATARRLTEQGYSVRIVTTQGAGGGVTYYKVWVGPYPRREDAVAAREKLRAEWSEAWIP